MDIWRARGRCENHRRGGHPRHAEVFDRVGKPEDAEEASTSVGRHALLRHHKRRAGEKRSQGRSHEGAPDRTCPTRGQEDTG